MHKNHGLLALVFVIYLLVLSGCSVKDSGAGNGAQDGNIPFQEQAPGIVGGGTENPQANGTPPQAQPDANVALSPIDACLVNATGAENADACLLSLAISGKNADPCMKLTAVSKRRCFKETALAALDGNLCAQVTDSALRRACYLGVAAGKSDISLCRQVPVIEDQDTCIKSIAIASKSVDGCNALFDAAAKDECYLAIAPSATDLSFCKKMSIRYIDGISLQDKCYLSNQQAMAKGDNCFMLSDAGLQSSCFLAAKSGPADANKTACTATGDDAAKESCNFWLATTTKNTGLCTQLPAERAVECTNKILDGNLPVEMCIGIKGAFEKNKCFVNAATSGKDANICELIDSNSLMRDNCISKVALDSGKAELCGKIRANNISRRDECYSAIALKLGNHSVCESVQADTAYYMCFASLAIKSNAPEVCDTSQRQRLRLLPYPGKDYCRIEYAVRKVDISLCEGFELEYLSSQCETKVNKVISCVSGDGACDEGLCAYDEDRDCPNPYACKTNLDCNDNDTGTTDSCNTQSGACTHTVVSS